MLISSNRPLEKLAISIMVSFYSIIPNQGKIYLRSFLSRLTAIYLGVIKLFHYGTIDMFDGIAIETTTYCNRQCKYCPNSIYDRGRREKEGLMPAELFKKIIDDLKAINFNGRLMPHLFGEPLLDKRLPQLLKYAHEQLPQASLSIDTNGDYLDKDLLDKLYESGVGAFYVTLHDKTDISANRIDQLIKYVKSSKKKIKIVSQVLDESTPLYTRAGLVKINKINWQLPCIKPIVIDYCGNVLLCCNDYFGDTAVGNVGKITLKEIWKSNIFINMRANLRHGIYESLGCQRCIKSMHVD